jgi:threonine/homoserine/homoserine lactone efflux protein
MLDILPAFLLAVVALALSPGPDMLFIISQSASHGQRAGFAATLGIATGIFVHTCLVSLGLAALLVESELAFKIIQYAGAGYLLYLGAKSILSKTSPIAIKIQQAKGRSYSFKKIYMQGLMVNLLNPKVILFFLAFLPLFVDPSLSIPIGWQLFILGLICNVLGSFIDGGIGYFFSFAKGWLENHPKAMLWQQRVMGVVFLFIALHLLFKV